MQIYDVRKQAGVTLVELVISIVIMSVAYTGIMMVMSQLSLTSADPMIREQATAIAQSYMEEIIAKPLIDPDGNEGSNAPQNCESGENRSTYDDVWDYDCVSDTSGAVSQVGGTPISELTGFNVQVNVSNTTFGGNPAVKIEIVVDHDGSSFSTPLVAYRLN